MHNTSAQTAALQETRSAAIVAAAVTLLLGVFLILGAGFAQSNAMHNAVHDARHAFSFPCH